MSAFTIYEKHPTADAYRVGGFYSPYALVSRDKRFTDAELAAEYFAAESNFNRQRFNEMSAGDFWDDAEWKRICRPMNIFRRFATLPHFDA